MSDILKQSPCVTFGYHVWMYPGRKWPYEGQPCACGATMWPAKDHLKATA